VLANLVGTIFGTIFWYGPMLLDAPLWSWLFIPDCPLGALLGSIGLLALRARRRWGFFYALTAFACMKYGIWTVLFWLRIWSVEGFAADPLTFLMEGMLFVTHIGLFIEGLLFVPYINPLSRLARLGVVGWFALSVYADYALDFHPPLPLYMFNTMAWIAAGLTALLALLLLALPYRATQDEPAPPATLMGTAR
jgi:uncharacterized membrane protein YpjA